MKDLLERLERVVLILEESIVEIAQTIDDSTGYVAAQPKLLMESVMKIIEIADPKKVSLELGCGNGSWTLLMAVAGFSSHGIEINPCLLDHAQRNYQRAVKDGLIDPSVSCTFTLGDMIPVNYSKDYDVFRKTHIEYNFNMPVDAVVHDSYEKIPINIETADIIYFWSWPTQSRFVYNMLQELTKLGTIFVLPSYIKYTQTDLLNKIEVPNRLFLNPVFQKGESFIGVRNQV